MRISTAQSQQLSIDAILRQQELLAKTQQQLASGFRVLTPSDDPAASVRILDFQKTIDQTAQYQDNIEAAIARLNIEESALDSASNTLIRSKELTIQALNGTLNNEDRLAIAAEIDQLLDNMLGIANTRNANGEYIFSGDLSDVQPFVFDETVGGYVYQGGLTQRVLQIAPDRQVADGDLGYRVFEDVDSVSLEASSTINGVPLEKRSVFRTLQTLSEALKGNFEDFQGKITGERFLRYGIDYAADVSFSLTVDGGTTDTITVRAGSYQTLQELVDEINAANGNTNPDGIANTSLSGLVEARAVGNRIEFVSLLPGGGTASSVQINNVSGTFLADAGFGEGQTGAGPDAGGITDFYQDTLQDVLADIDSALNSVLQTRTGLGARLNALDDQKSQNDKFELDLTEALSQTRDLDFTEAISRFNLQTVALQAAQQAYVRVQGLSLFNFL
ncbi:MAG: flagellar hook-associated protein FlgL [Gammaproteobacteria bacterium]